MRFDDQVAIVTGAGRGLGREYALLLGSRGANVIVNDFGGLRSGESVSNGSENGGGENCAQQVANEINSLRGGGRAIFDQSSISNPKDTSKLVERAISEFGRIDILINNAGILRDRSFTKMTLDDWDQVLNVHLRGSFLVSHLCWPIMQKQKYGRILMTSSTSGLYGNFGQANYAAAKMGLIGLSNTLAIEGKKNGINCNAIVPMADSRMTRDIVPDDLAELIKPSYVAPLAAWLCHRDCTSTGRVFEAAGCWFGEQRLHRSTGKYIREIRSGTGGLESIENSWNEITDYSQSKYIESFAEHLMDLMKMISK